MRVICVGSERPEFIPKHNEQSVFYSWQDETCNCGYCTNWYCLYLYKPLEKLISHFTQGTKTKNPLNILCHNLVIHRCRKYFYMFTAASCDCFVSDGPSAKLSWINTSNHHGVNFLNKVYPDLPPFWSYDIFTNDVALY